MKKFTLLIAMLFCILGYSQNQSSALKTTKGTSTQIEGAKKQTVKAIGLVSGAVKSNARKSSNALNVQSRVQASSNLAQSDARIPELLERMESLSNNLGSVNEFFSSEEQNLLRQYFSLNNGVISSRTSNIPAAFANANDMKAGVSASAGMTTYNVTTFNGTSFTNNGNSMLPELAYTSGPYFNIPGTPDVSQLQDASLGMGTFGFGAQIVAGNRVAEDFVLADDYDITSMVFYAYQSFETAPTVNEINLQIWDGDPADPGSSVIFGDTSTNVLTSAVASGAYRQLESAPGNLDRHLNAVTVEVTGLSLAAGTYWVDYSFGGTGASGPWAPPVVITGQSATGNAKQSIGGVWGDLVDVGAQGLPIEVYGDCTSCGGGGGTPVAYGQNASTGDYVSYDPAAPEVLTPLGVSPAPTFEGGGAIDPNDPATAYSMDVGGEFYSIDVATGVYTTLGTVNQPGSETVSGLEFDPVSGTLYMLTTDITTSTLSTIDIGALTSTPIAATGMAGGIALAIDGAGNGWSYDILDDNFYSVDLTTGAAAIVGPLGFDANFGQGMTYDPGSDQIYMSAFNNGAFQPEWRIVDSSNGSSTLVGVLGATTPGGLNQLGWCGVTGSGGGGGGGDECNQEVLSNNWENGFFTGTGPLAPGQVIATDITVDADVDFSLTTINAQMGARGSGSTITSADIIIYGESGGFPDNGNIIATYNGVVPTSQAFTQVVFTEFDALDVTFDIPATDLPGQVGVPTKYWVSIYGTSSINDDVIWEATSASLEGLEAVFSVDNGATWAGYASPFDMVYNFSGECTDITVIPDPTYDTCDGALPINCGEAVQGDTLTATTDAVPDCDPNVPGAPGVWYKFEDTSGLASNILVSTCSANTDYDTQLTIYTGDCPNGLVCVTNNDDSPNCSNFQSEAEFSSDGNSTFYILVQGWNGSVGNFELTLTCEFIPPPNDEIANAIDLDEVGCPFTDEDVAMPAATEEDGTPTDCDITGAAGVWYVFTPELNGFITGTIGTPSGGAGVTNLTVNNGPLQGAYNPVAAGFGGEIPTTPITEDGVVVIDDDATGDPNDACDPIINGADLNGKIAVLRRGSCEFGLKALAAQNEGAVAVVVVNNQPGDPIVMGGGEFGDQVTIPAVMISDEEGEPIIAAILGGDTVNMTLVSDTVAGVSSITFYTAPDESSTEDELVLVDYFQNQCLPSETATIPVVANQTYYCFVVNTGAVTDIIFDNCQLSTESNEIEGFAYYPNPANDRVNLSSVDNIEKVAVYNILGQKLMDLNVNATTTELNVSNLAAGTYIMEVTVNGQRGTYKVIKR